MAIADVTDPCALHDAALAEWYGDKPNPAPVGDDLRSLVLAQHYCNFILWGLEDEARRRDVGDAVIANLKHSIDEWNQRRNDLIERLDAAILEFLPPGDVSTAEQHSETAGQMIDRLSILALKIRHMEQNALRTDDPSLAEECAGKLAVLREQRRDLVRCLQRLLDDCMAGRRFFKLYRQFKMYNDPRLNPALAGGR